MTQAVFDGHNDLLLHLWRNGDRTGAGFFEGRDGHLDLSRVRAGGLTGGLFAIFVPEPRYQPAPSAAAAAAATSFETDRDDEGVEPDYARRATLEIASILLRMTEQRPDAIRLCRTPDEIAAAEAAGAVAAVMHLEGAEGIGADLDELEVLHAAGLRSLGPVWSRPNIFGHGVPFRFPSSPDTGPGLTDAGKALLAACNRMGILFDLSHLNEAGFWDVARLTDAPLVATHSNVHAISPASRNLTDRQLDAIAESGGLVGLNYAVSFLREDGERRADTPLSLLVRHLAYLVEKLGEDGVALGSDFDGAQVPAEIGSAAGLQALVAAMKDAGFGDRLVAKICHDNWIGLLGRISRG